MRLLRAVAVVFLVAPLLPVWAAFAPHPALSPFANVAAAALPGITPPVVRKDPVPVIPHLASLSTDISVAPDPVTVGTPILVKITITNHAPDAATDLAVTLPMPVGATPLPSIGLVSASAGWQWTNSSLAGNASVTFAAPLTVASYPAEGALVVQPLIRFAGLPIPLTRTGGAIIEPSTPVAATTTFVPGAATKLSGTDTRVAVDVPGQTASEALTVRYDRKPGAGESPPALPHAGRTRGFGTFYLSATNGAGQAVHQLAAPVTIHAQYTPAQLQALGIAEGDLTLFWWNDGTATATPAKTSGGTAARGQWQPLPSTVDPKTHTVSAPVSHFSNFQAGDGSKPADAFVPSIDGWQVSANTGAATYSYPISVPAGAGGIKPSLALSYDSSQTDDTPGTRPLSQSGWVGKGWSFDTGSIRLRENSTGQTTGYTLVLNGRNYDLTPVGGAVAAPSPDNPTYGLDPTQYHWHIADENFMRVTVSGAGSSANGRGGSKDNNALQRYQWTIWATDGMRYDFQEDAWWGFIGCPRYMDGSLVPPGMMVPPGASFGWMETYEWKLSKATDTHGNTITYQYDRMTDSPSSPCGTYVNMSGTVDVDVWLKSVTWGVNDQYQVFIESTSERPFDNDVEPSPNQFGAPPRETRQLSALYVQSKASAGAGYQYIRVYNLNHEYDTPIRVDSLTDTTKKITLGGITQWGNDFYPGCASCTHLPKVSFTYGLDPGPGPVIAGAAFRLTHIDNGQGGSVDFAYENIGAFVYPNPAYANLRRVAQQTVNDGIGGSEATNYTYGGAAKNFAVDPYQGMLSSAAIYLNAHWGTSIEPAIKEGSEFRGHTFTVEIHHQGTPQEERITRYFYQGYTSDAGATACTPSVSGSDLTAYDNDACFVTLRTNEALRGRVYEEDVDAPNSIGHISTTTYSYKVDFSQANGDYSVFPYYGIFHGWARESARTETYAEGGTATSHTTRYAYDAMYGNRVQTDALDQHGALYRSTLNTYVFRDDPGTYLVNRVAETDVRDGTGVRVAFNQTYYDGNGFNALGTTGDATHTLAFFTLGSAEQSAPQSSDATYTYDGFGNRLTATTYTGPNATGAARTTTTTYDPDFHAFPLTVSSPPAGGVTLTESATYDYRMGTLLTVTDANGQVSEAQYDTFGRMSEAWNHANDSPQYPTVQVYYYDYTPPPMGSPEGMPPPTASAIPAHFATATRTSSGAGGSITPVWKYYDGRGRVVQTYTYGANGQFLTTDALYQDGVSVTLTGQSHAVAYNGAAFALPMAGDASERWTKSERDALGRVVKVTAPDSTVSTTRFASTAVGSLVTAVDGNGHQTSEESDIWGRGVTTREYTGVTPNVTLAATTTASYDLLDHLVSTTDAAGITSSTSYDALGRVLSVSDADRGVSQRQYDAAGNLTQTVDAKNQVIGYGYDALDRLIAMSGGITATNTYDGDAAYPNDTNTKGKLVTAISGPASSRLSTVHSTYDARGRVASTTETIGTTAATFSYGYDDAGRVTSLTYPDGEVVTTTYDVNGSPLVVQSNPASGTVNYVGNASYNALGQPTTRVTGDSLLDQWSYDAPLSRLVRRQLGTGTQTPASRLDRSYSYDNVGNLTTLTDNLLPSTPSQQFTYTMSETASCMPRPRDTPAQQHTTRRTVTTAWATSRARGAPPTATPIHPRDTAPSTHRAAWAVTATPTT